MIKRSKSERVFSVFNTIILFILMLLCAYPMFYVLCASFSDPMKLMAHDGFLFKPLGFDLNAYKTVLANPELYTGYGNTILYVVAGAALNMIMTLLGGFCLSRKNLLWKNTIMLIFAFTMYFGGGLIPTYLIVESLGLVNSRWSMIIIGCVSTYNMIIMRTAIYGIPDSIEEAAEIDGAGHLTVLWRIVAPLCKPTIAVLALFYIFGKWNDWFNPMIYLRDRSKYPLQTFLRELLIIENTTNAADEAALRDTANLNMSKYVIQYCTIIVSTAPILCVYPFLQKYFASGVMVGAVKG